MSGKSKWYETSRKDVYKNVRMDVSACVHVLRVQKFKRLYFRNYLADQIDF